MELSLIDENYEVIVGQHSIAHALKNPKRNVKKIFGTSESLKELRKNAKFDEFLELNVHDLQTQAKKYIEKTGFRYSRIPSNLFMVAQKQPEFTHLDFYEDVENSEKYSMLVLDQISDVHNGAAIMRSAAFFGVNTIVVSGKNSFGLSPSFTRIASGAYEYVNILQVNSIAKFLPKLKEKGVQVVGFSEHASESVPAVDLPKICLVLGNEEKGISHAVMRLLDHTVCLKSNGQIKSLNVSAASILAMERILKIES